MTRLNQGALFLVVAVAAASAGCGDDSSLNSGAKSDAGSQRDATASDGGGGAGGTGEPGGTSGGAGGSPLPGGDTGGTGGSGATGGETGGTGGDPGGSGGVGGGKGGEGGDPNPGGAPGDAGPTGGTGGVPADAALGGALTPDVGAGGLEADIGVPPTPDNMDGDPFTVQDGDCDDLNPDVYPGATENCDGLDNDCDLEIDGQVVSCYEGPEATLGVGACHPGTRTCTLGAVGACEGQVLPAGAEICDDLRDDTCDGTADEGCDGDGDGVTVAAGDCNDADGTVFPGADEICDAQDNDCDGATDGVTMACYPGAEGTEGVGPCHGGQTLCVNGMFGECEGFVAPAASESCDDEVDDDCDGVADDGCIVDPACLVIDRDSAVTVTSTCLAVGGDAVPLVRVELRDSNGAPLPARQVDIQLQPALPLAFRNVLSNGATYFRGFEAGNLPGEHRVNVTVACGAQRVALRSHPVVQVVPAVVPGPELVTGGCDLAGDAKALVTDAETGAPVANAWLMVGTDPNARLQPLAADAIRGIPGNAVPAASDPGGGPALHDYGGTLRGAVTLTVGAEGYENVTLAGLNASVIAVPLRAVAPPPPAETTVSGRVSDFDSLRVDGQLDIGIVLSSFDISFLATLNLSRLFSHDGCWDPLTQGLAADLLDEITLPDNLYIPAQREGLILLPVPVTEHRYTLNPQPLGRENIVAISGKVPTDNLLDLLTNGGSLEQVLPLIRMTEIGVARDLDIAGPIANQPIPLSERLVENAGCSVENSPLGATVLCVSAGDWSGANGSGRLFPLGFNAITPDTLRDADGPTMAVLPTVARNGVFRDIGYLGAAIALFVDEEDTPPGLSGGVSAVIDRTHLSANGGTVEAASFFDVPSLSRDELTVNWGAVENATSPTATVCKVEFFRIVRRTYDPGECSGERSDDLQLPVWTGYVPGDTGTLALPNLPNGWPREDDDGLIDLGDTPEDDRLVYRISCLGLGEAPGFDYHRGNFRELRDGLTHFALNEKGF